jgi:hypothetical protein
MVQKSIADNQKKRGRPATGSNPMSGIRFSPFTKNRIKQWGRDQLDKPSFAESVRRLVESALSQDLDEDD